MFGSRLFETASMSRHYTFCSSLFYENSTLRGSVKFISVSNQIWSTRQGLCSSASEENKRVLANGAQQIRGIRSRISEGLSHHFHKRDIPFLEMTTGKLLESAVEKWPNRECLISLKEKRSLSYSQVLRRADKLAAGLSKLGIKRGDRIGIWGPNQIDWFVSFLAIVRAGCIMVGINPAYRQSEIDYCLNKVGARAVFAPRTFKTQNYAEMLLNSKDKCPDLQHILIFGNDFVNGTRCVADVESLASESEIQAIAAMQSEISPHDGCNIQFTSGTTGKPKATLVSHRSFVNNSRQGAERLGLTNDHEKICLNVPFFHAFGMVMGQFAMLHSGATTFIESPTFNPITSIETIVREKCTITYGTPTMWINMLDARERLQAPVETLRGGITGGSLISPDIIRKIKQQLRCEQIGNIYGLSETTAIVFQSLPNEPSEMTENTVGHLSDNVEVMVVDNEGAAVPIGTSGELWVRGYNNMMKYWDDEENTRKTLTEDGWLKTGDQFVLRNDAYGHVVGRIKDIVIRGGENIFPKEVEHLLESHPDVREAQVFGVYDPIYGEEICACLRLSNNSRLTENGLRAFCKGKIAHFKIPRYIQFVDSYPRTASGKIQKYKIREHLENNGIVPVNPHKN